MKEFREIVSPNGSFKRDKLGKVSRVPEENP